MAQPPFHLLFPPFIALVPWAVWTARLPAGSVGSGRALAGGFLLGIVHHGLLLHWLPGAFLWFTVLAPVAALAVVVLLAGVSAAGGWVLHRLVVERGAPLWFALPAVWTLVEWIPSLLGGFSMPWLGLGFSLTGFPRLLAPAELGGALAVAGWLAAVNGGLGHLLLQGRRGRFGLRPYLRPAAVLPALLLLAGPMGWSLHRDATLELEPGMQVAALGLPIMPDPLGDRPVRARRALERGRSLLSELKPEGVALVLWPEAAVPLYLDAAEGAPYRRALAEEADRLGARFLVGSYLEGDGPLNAVTVVEGGGELGDRYGKRHLVPGVEGIPGPLGRLPGVRPVGGGRPGQGFASGDGPETLQAGEWEVVPLICWEVAFPRQVPRTAEGGGVRLLVNASNDTFLGPRGAPMWLGWPARRQHEAHLILRAVEHRVPALRAATAGGSFLVDPKGRVTHRAPGDGAGLVVGTAMNVRTHSTLPWVARWGEVGTGLFALTALLLAPLLLRLRSRFRGRAEVGALRHESM